MEKLAAYVVREGGLSSDDAVGWIVRLAVTLAPMHRLAVAHGRVSAKAIQIAHPSCTSLGYLLDAGDLSDDPAYFSMERVIGAHATPADDTWAVGVTLYSMLTGELPYRGTTLDEMRALIAGPPPSPLAVFDVGDDSLQRVLDQVFTSNVSHRIVKLDVLRARLIEARPAVAGLPALEYGKPDDEEADEDGAVLTTAIFNCDKDVNEMVREAKRRMLGASALTGGAAAPRRVRAPAPPSSPPQPCPPPDRNYRAALDIIESAIPAPGAAHGAGDRRPLAPIAEPPSLVPASDPAPASPRPWPAPRPDELPAPPRPQVNPPIGPHLSRPEAPPFSPPGPTAPQPLQPSRPLPTAPLPLAPIAIAEHLDASEIDIRDHTSSQAHVASIGPPRSPRRTGLVTYALGALCVIVGAVAAYVVLGEHGAKTVASPEAETSASPSAEVPHDPGAKSAAPAVITSASAVPHEAATPSTTVDPPASSVEPVPPTAASSSASPAGGETPGAPSSASGDVTRCVVALFPTDTFESSSPSFTSMCTTNNPVQGASNLQLEIVRAGGGDNGTTTGMAEISTMGWYKLAAFAIARGHCCTSPAALSTPTTLDCKLDDALDRLAREVSTGGDIASEEALQRVTTSFYCLAHGGAAEAFGQRGMPNGGELTIFLRLFARARTIAMQKTAGNTPR